jgi:hypothetical protein
VASNFLTIGIRAQVSCSDRRARFCAGYGTVHVYSTIHVYDYYSQIRYCLLVLYVNIVPVGAKASRAYSKKDVSCIYRNQS